MKPIIIYPSVFNNINKVDPDYQFELEVAEELNFQVAMFNHDNFISFGDKVKLNITKDTFLTKKTQPAIYRGWMLKPEDYIEFYSSLKTDYNIVLINSPKEYEATHCFINSYNRLEKYTPKTIWFPDEESIDWGLVRKIFDKFIVKDYVKSVKGFDFPEYLESSKSNQELNDYIDRFKKLRGDLYTGGIALKQYVELDKSDNHTHEFRAFYINGKARLMYANSNNEDDLIPCHSANQYDLECLHSSFYTIDFARLITGEYIVVETGDGQVSGIPSKEIAYKLYEQLNNAKF